jgi:hypothetical protein
MNDAGRNRPIGCIAAGFLILAGALLAHRWLLFAVALLLFTVLVLWMVFAQPGRPPVAQKTVVASPPVVSVPDTLAALASLGLEAQSPEPARWPLQEADLVRSVQIRTIQDLLDRFEELASAAGGLLIPADKVALQVARLDIELTHADRLRLLNAQLDPARGQFFFASKMEERVVFLTPAQVEALGGRGWRIDSPAEERQTA